jgi:MFS family permease
MGEILHTKTLLFPLLNLAIAQAVIGVIAVLAPALASILFHQSLTAASVKLIVPAALAMVLGAILVGQLGKKVNKVRMINYGIVLAVFSLLGLGLVHRVQDWPVFIVIVISVSALMGLANAFVTVSAQTLLQINTSDEQRGKVFGALNMLVNVAALIPVILAGISADILSPTTVLIGAALLLAVFGIFQRFAFRGVTLKSI